MTHNRGKNRQTGGVGRRPAGGAPGVRFHDRIRSLRGIASECRQASFGKTPQSRRLTGSTTIACRSPPSPIRSRLDVVERQVLQVRLALVSEAGQPFDRHDAGNRIRPWVGFVFMRYPTLTATFFGSSGRARNPYRCCSETPCSGPIELIMLAEFGWTGQFVITWFQALSGREDLQVGKDRVRLRRVKHHRPRARVTAGLISRSRSDLIRRGRRRIQDAAIAPGDVPGRSRGAENQSRKSIDVASWRAPSLPRGFCRRLDSQRTPGVLRQPRIRPARRPSRPSRPAPARFDRADPPRVRSRYGPQIKHFARCAFVSTRSYARRFDGLFRLLRAGTG